MSACEHEYRLDRYLWNGARLYEVLRCGKCGHESWAWTTPDSDVLRLKRRKPNIYGEYDDED